MIRIGDELELVGDAEDSVFFTTDGTDPLTDRGTLNATAVLYQDRRSLWNEGDWNGDGVFDSADLVFAFRIGVFNEDVE
ncbi:MAG: hypothetical protein KDA92_00480 [Planctomycetales bacterium]|nr:hypothetical protein [Planctomycetales bacterium]